RLERPVAVVAEVVSAEQRALEVEERVPDPGLQRRIDRARRRGLVAGLRQPGLGDRQLAELSLRRTRRAAGQVRAVDRCGRLREGVEEVVELRVAQGRV